MTSINSTGNASAASKNAPLAPSARGTAPAAGGPEPHLDADHLSVHGASLAVPGADPLAAYPVGKGGPDLAGLTDLDGTLLQQARDEARAIEAQDKQATGGNVVARGFNHFVNLFNHREDKLGVAKAKALNALTHDMNDALARYHAQVQAGDPNAEANLKAALGGIQANVKAFDDAAGKLKQGNKFWSGIAADVVAGVTVVAGVALTATGVGAPIGVPLLAAGAFAAGGAVAVGAHAALDNQFDFKHEALTTFAVGGVGGVAAALTGGASEAVTAGLTGQAARIVGQEAIQGAGARLAIGAAANSVVGAGFGAATSGVQAVASGEDLAGVAKATALGAAGGAVGGVAAAGLGSALGVGAKAAQRALATEDTVLARGVNTAVNATETSLGRAATSVTKGVVTGAGAGGAAAVANAVASGQPIDFASLRDQILAGAIQGGAFAGAGLAGKALPQRSPVKAPPSPEETNRTLKALAPRGNAALAEQHGQLVENYRAAQQQALARMEALRQAERTIATEPNPEARAAAVKDQVASFDQAMRDLDAARGRLVDFARTNLQPAAARRIVAAVGEPNQNVEYDRSLDSASGAKHNEAVLAFLAKFPDLGLDGIAQPGVNGLSPRALQAVSEALNTEASSSDMKGAANVEHLASVLKGVLETAAREKGAPLTQAEVDQRAAVTVLTDAWMKGGSPQSLDQVATAPTNAGRTAGAVWERMIAKSMGLASASEIPDNVRPILRGWVEKGQVWKDTPAVPAGEGKPGEPARTAQENAAAALKAAGVPDAQARDWAQRFVAHPKPWPAPFLLGTWTHGIPAFDSIEGVVKSLGGDHAMAQAYYEEVLAHHASGFVMNGFAQADLTVDFHQLARDGALTPEAAQRLTNLYASATTLAGKWRPVIDLLASGKPLNLAQYETFRSAVGLRPLAAAERQAYQQLGNGQGRPITAQELQQFRRAYSAEARDYRDAIAKLPANSQSQLLNDDRMQFTPIGMPKWIGMMKMQLDFAAQANPNTPRDNAAVLKAVYNGAVQAYAEENYARGRAVGDAFDATASPIAARLGMAFDPATRTYHAAAPNEPAFGELARRITADPQLSQQLAAAKIDTGNPQAVVDWFRNQPADVAALNRLVAVETPGAS